MRKAFVISIIVSVVIFMGISLLVLMPSGRQQELAFWDTPEGCTVILVGKNASADGSVMTTQSADCSVCDWTWRYVPPRDYEPSSVRRIYHKGQLDKWPQNGGLQGEEYESSYTGLDIPQVPHTYGYLHSVFGYLNEHQLAFGESTIGCQRKMNNATPAAKFDITMLTILAMERCKTAREAIKLMGGMAEKYGYGHDSGEMLAVADPKEVWLFEIMPVGPLWTPESGKPGAVWCAQRIPDDQVSVCPNESRIGEIDLKNREYFMASPNVISYAVENGYYDPDSGVLFNWKKAYSPNEASALSSGGTLARLWRFFNLVAPSRNLGPEIPNMELPFSIKPDKKLSLQDIIDITRDKYQGTQFDPADGLRGGPFGNPNYHPRSVRVEGRVYSTSRTISVNRAEYTTVTQSRSWLPNPIGGVVWISFGAQDTACYMPFYAGVTAIPDSFTVGDHWEFDRASARWAFDYVDFHAQVAYSHAFEDIKKAKDEWEKAAIARLGAIDKTAQELYRQDPSLAVEFLTEYCVNNAEKVIKTWWELGDRLLVKYNHLSIYDSSTRRRSDLPYPEWWLKEVIRYHKLEPREERK